MQSKTSYFNRTVFINDCKRYWPLTAGYGLFLLLLLPLERLTTLNHTSEYLSAWNICYETLEIAAHGGYWIAFFTSILFAMASFSYLTNPRATNGLHALPARRETLYFTHYLSGLCGQLSVQVLAVLLTTAVLTSRGVFDAHLTGLMLLAMILPTLFFYSFGVFCMIFTGQMLAAPVFYFVLNILVVGVELLVRTFAGDFLYGWSGDTTPVLIEFSPVVKLLSEIGVGKDYAYSSNGAGYAQRISGVTLMGIGWLWFYAAVGLVLAALGLLVYRTRHSEATGNIVAVNWARPVFKYGVTFCAALALGQLLYYLFFGQYRYNGDYSLAGTLLCMAAAGLIGYFAAEMLLKKSLRVFRSGWKGAAGVTAALVLLGCCMTFDLTGYEGYVPDAGQIQSARVDFAFHNSGVSFHAELSDAETMRLLTEAHRALALDKARQQRVHRETDEWPIPGTGGGWFDVSYTLKSGRIVTRSYSHITIYAEELGDPASGAATLTAFYNAPIVALQRSVGWDDWASRVTDPRTLTDLRFTGGYVDQEVRDADGNYDHSWELDLSPAEAKAVFDAISRDALAGRADASLFDNPQSMAGSITLFASYIDTKDPSSGYIHPDADEDGRVTANFCPVVTTRMIDTITTLCSLGIVPEFN